MKRIALLAFAVFGVASTGIAWGKAPAGATGECKDGTYTEAKSKEGACSSHGGVKTWLAAAEAPARPAGSTGECKDDTFTDAASKSGACSGHKGVKEWYGASASDKAAAASKSTKAASETREPSTQTQVPSATSDRRVNPQPTATPSPQPAPRPTTAAAGGGGGKVWVNTNSKVYHCESDALYGKTKKGEYMTEADAKAAGARPARGKVCS